MNIAGLIGIAIALVVGVSLVPVIVDTVNDLNQTNTPSAVLNLADLLPIGETVAFESNLNRITSQIRGNLSLKRYGNPELNCNLLHKCVETRWFASLWDGGIVQA